MQTTQTLQTKFEQRNQRAGRALRHIEWNLDRAHDEENWALLAKIERHHHTAQRRFISEVRAQDSTLHGNL